MYEKLLQVKKNFSSSLQKSNSYSTLCYSMLILENLAFRKPLGMLNQATDRQWWCYWYYRNSRGDLLITGLMIRTD